MPSIPIELSSIIAFCFFVYRHLSDNNNRISSVLSEVPSGVFFLSISSRDLLRFKSNGGPTYYISSHIPLLFLLGFINPNQKVGNSVDQYHYSAYCIRIANHGFLLFVNADVAKVCVS